MWIPAIFFGLFLWFLYSVGSPNFWPIIKVIGVIAGIFFGLGLLGALAAGKQKTPEEEEKESQEKAGQEAERQVKHLLQGAFDPKWLLHSALLVFHKSTREEYSRELDHIYVGNNRLFVVETKYKAGTVNAWADAEYWQVNSSGHMRNALHQAKKACKVLSEELNIALELFIPVVAIYSEKGTQVVNGPSNVVTAKDVAPLIALIDSESSDAKFNRGEVLDKLRRFISSDRIDVRRHIERAQSAKDNRERRQVITNISLPDAPKEETAVAGQQDGQGS